MGFLELSKKFGRSPCAVQRACERRGIVVTEAPPPTSLAADRAQASEGFWKEQHRALDTKYQKLLKESSAVDRLVADVKQLAPKSYETAPAVRRSGGKKPNSTPQSAVLHLSDSHVGQEVHADQTMHFGHYNKDVFADRLAYLEEAVHSICTEHVTTRVPTLHIAWGGDLLHGDLAHGNEAAHVVTLFDQYYLASHLFAQFVRNVAPLFDQVQCWGVVGNHTRWAGTQRRMPTVNRFSNLDMFVLSMIQALTTDVVNVKWGLSTQPFVEFDVQGYVHHLSHGDHLRGGDKALGVPSHALGRELSVTSQLYAKHGKRPVNYYLHGHFHRPMEIPHAGGEILVNGGWPGIDEYALTSHFNPADPQQRLYFVHPSYGRTANYYLSLKHASPGCGAARYKYPVLES
jgi:hypothetical protein